MRSIICRVAWSACWWLASSTPGFSQTEAVRPEAEPAWGKAFKGVSAGPVADDTTFESGEDIWIGLRLHLRNDGLEQVTLPGASAEHGFWGGGRDVFSVP